MGLQIGGRLTGACLELISRANIDEDQIIDVMTRETAIKDPAVYRQMKYTWIDPNGTLRRAVLEADSELWRDQGLLPAAVDLSQVYDDRYREFALQYLGEYQPPR